MPGGKNRMPPPMTFATMIAAASNGPSRRSSAAPVGGAEVEVGSRATYGSVALLGQELPRDLHLLQLDPLRRALLGKNLGVEVAEEAVLQHVAAALRGVAGITLLGPDHERRGLGSVGKLDVLDEHVVPVIGVSLGLEDDVERERDAGVGGLLEPERHARDELVLALDDTGIVPAGREIGDLDRLLEVDRLRAARRQEDGEQEEGDAAAHDPRFSRKRREPVNSSGSAGGTRGVWGGASCPARIQNWRFSTRLMASSFVIRLAMKSARSLPLIRSILVCASRPSVWPMGTSLPRSATVNHSFGCTSRFLL